MVRCPRCGCRGGDLVWVGKRCICGNEIVKVFDKKRVVVEWSLRGDFE